MQRAKSFLFVCLGILALVVAYHFGATTATAQAPGNAVVGVTNGSILTGWDMTVVTSNGDIYSSANGSFQLTGNLFSATAANQDSWGSIKRRYLSPDAPRSGQASRPRR